MDMLPSLSRTGRDAAYLLIALATSIAAFTVVVAAVTLSLTLLVFVVGVPVIIASALLFRWTADLDRRNAELVFGRRVYGRYRDHRRATLFGRFKATVSDPQTWRDLAWLMLHSIVGFTFGVIAVSLVASVAALAFLPAWYWALPNPFDAGLWQVHSLPVALATALLALPLGLVTVYALRGMAKLHASLAAELLGG